MIVGKVDSAVQRPVGFDAARHMIVVGLGVPFDLRRFTPLRLPGHRPIAFNGATRRVVGFPGGRMR